MGLLLVLLVQPVDTAVAVAIQVLLVCMIRTVSGDQELIIPPREAVQDLILRMWEVMGMSLGLRGVRAVIHLQGIQEVMEQIRISRNDSLVLKLQEIHLTKLPPLTSALTVAHPPTQEDPLVALPHLANNSPPIQDHQGPLL